MTLLSRIFEVRPGGMGAGPVPQMQNAVGDLAIPAAEGKKNDQEGQAMTALMAHGYWPARERGFPPSTRVAQLPPD